MKRLKQCLLAGFGVIGLMLLSLGVTFGVMWIRGRRELQQAAGQNVELEIPQAVAEENSVQYDGTTVLYHGQRYAYNSDMVAILCMGVDQAQLEGVTDPGEQAGRADALVLAALDTGSGRLTLINISRDSIAEVDQYNERGEWTGAGEEQICLAYTYGDGREKSCENTVQAVSRLFYGLPIHGYAAISLRAVGPLNDAVGGVSVDVLEDVPEPSGQLRKGRTVVLNGDQALAYVKWRNFQGEDAPVDANNYRMERQKQYMKCFIRQALEKTKSNLLFPKELYQIASDYMITNLTASRVSYLASVFAAHGLEDNAVLTVPGTIEERDNYALYHVDDKALYDMILAVFYQKIS